MPPPRPPSRVEPLSFPVFGISWYADPADGRSIYAYTGGGGSARTGVFNKIVIQDANSTEAQTISTGDLVGLALQIYKHPISQRLWMVVALGKQVRRYTIPDGRLCGVLSFEDRPHLDPKLYDSCVALAVNGMADKLAVGFESGHIAVFAITDADDPFVAVNEDTQQQQPIFTCSGHEKAICSVCFSMHRERVLSSAKDGTARVWNAAGECLSVLKCVVEDPKMHGSKILVRGCAFADLQGQQILTVASPRRGKAYLARWIQAGSGGGAGERDPTQPPKFECRIRTECSPCPISAMSISLDACLLALGAVDGSITLWNVVDWKPFKIFKEVHDLPVTCIAARPFPVPLQGEEWTGVSIHARSASADSQLACLTLQTKVPRRTEESGYSTGRSGIMVMIHRMLMTAFLLWIMSPIAREAVDRCEDKWRADGLEGLRRCVIEEVLIAPSWRPGISSPLY